MRSPVAEYRHLQDLVARRIIKSVEIRVGYRGDAWRYEVVVQTFRRRSDGTLGKWANAPVYFEDNASPDYAVLQAHDWIKANVIEATRESQDG